MRTRKEDLKRLKKVTEAVWLASSQKLREKANAERAGQARLDGLARDRQRCLDLIASENGPDVAQILSATNWMRWSEAERARQNIALARLRAELAQEQAVAKRAFAKDQAMGKLLTRAQILQKKLRNGQKTE